MESLLRELSDLGLGLAVVPDREGNPAGISVWVREDDRFPTDTVWVDRRIGQEDIAGPHYQQLYVWGPNFEMIGTAPDVVNYFDWLKRLQQRKDRQ